MSTFKEILKDNNILLIDDIPDKNDIQVDEDIIYNIISGMFSFDDSISKFNIDLFNSINWGSEYNISYMEYIIKAFHLIKNDLREQNSSYHNLGYKNLSIILDYNDDIKSFFVKEIII